jgi:hypothetical protein
MDGCEHDLDSCHYFPDGRLTGNKIFILLPYVLLTVLLTAAMTGICKDPCRFAIPDGNSCRLG